MTTSEPSTCFRRGGSNCQSEACFHHALHGSQEYKLLTRVELERCSCPASGWQTTDNTPQESRVSQELQVGRRDRLGLEPVREGGCLLGRGFTVWQLVNHLAGETGAQTMVMGRATRWSGLLSYTHLSQSAYIYTWGLGVTGPLICSSSQCCYNE